MFQYTKHIHFKLDFKKTVTSHLNVSTLLAKIYGLILCAVGDIKGRAEFLANEFSIWENTIQINFLRTVELILLLLHKVLQSTGKTLTVIISTNIKLPSPKCLAYTYAKMALRPVVENLCFEYTAKEQRVIEILLGIKKTNFAFHRTQAKIAADHFYSTLSSVMDPEVVTNSLLWALEKDPAGAVTKLEVQPTHLSR